MSFGSRSRLWFYLSLLLVVGIVGYIVFTTMHLRPAVPEEGVAQPTEQVVQPDIETLEDVKEYTGGRPIPPGRTLVEVPLALFARENEHFRGSREVPLTIVEYANLINPYATLMHPEIMQLVTDSRYSGKINVVFRHYPDHTNELDYEVANVSECLAEYTGEEAFWQFVDTVYQSGVESLDQSIGYAVDLGAEETNLRRCSVEKEFEADRVVYDKLYAIASLNPVSVVPFYYFVHNETGEVRFFQGIDTMDFVRSILDEMLGL